MTLTKSLMVDWRKPILLLTIIFLGVAFMGISQAIVFEGGDAADLTFTDGLRKMEIYQTGQNQLEKIRLSDPTGFVDIWSEGWWDLGDGEVITFDKNGFSIIIDGWEYKLRNPATSYDRNSEGVFIVTQSYFINPKPTKVDIIFKNHWSILTTMKFDIIITNFDNEAHAYSLIWDMPGADKHQNNGNKITIQEGNTKSWIKFDDFEQAIVDNAAKKNRGANPPKLSKVKKVKQQTIGGTNKNRDIQEIVGFFELDPLETMIIDPDANGNETGTFPSSNIQLFHRKQKAFWTTDANFNSNNDALTDFTIDNSKFAYLIRTGGLDDTDTIYGAKITYTL